MASSTSGFIWTVSGLQKEFVRDVHETRYEDLLTAHATLASVLAQLRRHLYTLPPVGKLPPELLTRIFALFMQRPEDSLVFRSLQDPEPSKSVPIDAAPLLTLTHVCHHWRTVGLNTPALWTHIDDRCIPRLEAFVARSQPMPLSMVVGADRLGTEVLPRCGPRLRRLDILVHDAVASTALSLGSVLSLPLLECLTVKAQHPFSVGEHAEANQISFEHPISHLKALALSPVPPWPLNYQFPGLTHLNLDWRDDSARIPSSQYLHELTPLLTCTPALQYLHLAHMDIGQDSEGLRYPGFPPSPIRLSSMRALTCVLSNMTTAVYLLSLLELPPNVLVRLDRLRCRSPLETDFSPHTAASPPFVSSCSSAQLFMNATAIFLLAEGPESGLWIRAKNTAIERPAGDSGPCWRSSIFGLERLHVLPSIRSLTMRLRGGDEDAFREVLQRMHSLERLTVILKRGCGLDTRANACGAFAALRDPASCPRLDSLVLLYGAKYPRSISPRELATMLQERANRGQPLGRLAMQQYWWSSTPGRDLKKLEAGRQRWIEAFEAIFPSLRQYVGAVEIAGSDDTRPFIKRSIWGVDKAGDHWAIPPMYRPINDLPEGWPAPRES